MSSLTSTEDTSTVLSNSQPPIAPPRPTHRNLNDLRQTKSQIQFDPVIDINASLLTSLASLDSTPKLILYKYRWIILLVYSLSLVACGIAMVTTTSIGTVIENTYGVPNSISNICLLTFYIMYVPFNFVAIKVVERWGLRVCITTGALLTLIGIWIRCLANVAGFYACLSGTIIASCGMPFILNCLSKLVSTWFADKERAIATAISSLAIPLGCLFGFLISTLMFDDSDADTENSTVGREHFLLYLLIQSALITILLVPVILLNRAKPPSPPSVIASPQYLEKMGIFAGLKMLLSNKDYMNLFFTFNFIYGNYTALSTSFTTITGKYLFTVTQNSILCIAFLLGGIISSFVMGFILDAFQNYKKLICVICIGSGCLLCLNLIVLPLNNFYLEAVLMTATGVFIVPITVISYSFACELAYPVPEPQAIGLMISASLIWGTALYLISQFIASFGTEYVLLLWAGLAGFSGFTSFCLKEDLRRLQLEDVLNSTYIEESELMKQSQEFRVTVFDTMNVIGDNKSVRLKFQIVSEASLESNMISSINSQEPESLDQEDNSAGHESMVLQFK